MMWIVKTSVGAMPPNTKFLSTNLIEADTIEDVLLHFQDQWEEAEEDNGTPVIVDNFHLYAVPWRPTIWQASNHPDTMQIEWKPA